MYDAEFDQEQFDRDFAARGRSRSRSFVADEEEEDVQYPRGRTRSQSFSATSVSDDELTPTSSRRRSRSFVSDNGSDDGQEESQMESIARAASLSKIYLAGGTPVDPNNLPPPKHGKRKSGKTKTGVVTGSALDALSAGLQTATRLESRNMTEEELEERKMAEEEAQKLKDEKESHKKPTAQSRAMALASKAASLKTSLFNRTLGTRSNSNKDVSEGSLTGTASTSRDSTKSDTPAQPRKKHKLKLLLLGDSGVGKTSLLRVLSGDPFSESMLATAGVDFKLRNIVVEDRDVALQIWDTAGQERFHRITATYYKGANGIILVYDVNDPKGFENVGYWMNNIQQYSSPNLPAMLLVGNKIDLPNRKVAAEEGQSTAAQYHCRFLETSAKTSENVEDALHTIATDALFLSLHAGMTQKELLEKEKLYGARGLRKENCVLS